MSARLFESDILFFQRLLRIDGLYKGALDGIWGAKTEAAALLFEQHTQKIRATTKELDARSERCISTLSLKAQKEARLCLGRILDAGIRARIISGTRTYTEQNALYKQGRFGNPPPIVTKARGGQSNHNFGIAWDIGIFTAQGGYLQDGEEYDRAGHVGKNTYVEWGGDWKKFVDKPHYQLRLGIDVVAMRTAFEAGLMMKGYDAFTTLAALV
jgi:peptidoglycan LD-endopeptidase CwlK